MESFSEFIFHCIRIIIIIIIITILAQQRDTIINHYRHSLSSRSAEKLLYILLCVSLHYK